jgi:murein DD-endopeptidase MepM/ murein hydrolase activator NlpD
MHRSRAGTLVLLVLTVACGGVPASTLTETTPSGSHGVIEQFFTPGEATSGSIEPGGEFELPDGGTIAIPQGDFPTVAVTVTEAQPTEDGVRAFTEWSTDTELAGPVYQVRIGAGGAPPDLLIVTRPASDPNSRIFVACCIDSDTGDPDWTPQPSSYDAETGTVTAAVALAVFQPLQSVEPQARNLAALAPLSAQAQAVTHVAYIGVGVGGQTFQSEIELVVEEPPGPLELQRNAPPIKVLSQVAARLIHITHKPLDTLTVTSDFGPRTTDVPGASNPHRGVDYRAANGTNVYAAGDGSVTLARCQLNSVNCGRTARGGVTGGFAVEITHGDGEKTIYRHMTNPSTVSVGDAVTAGQVIGLSGSTGGVDPHLHFEVLKNGVHVDPELIFNEQVTTTIAMAIDFRIQEDTEQELNLVLGRDILPGDLVRYDTEVELTGVAPGEHALQFLAIRPDRSVEVLAYIPLTITGGISGVTGSYILARDIRTDVGGGYVETDKQITQATFSLVAVGENRLEGQGHMSFVRAYGYAAPTDCPFASTIGSVEWDVFYEGEFDVNSDGSIDVQFTGTPRHCPDYIETFTFTGCEEQNSTQTVSGRATVDISITLVDGEYYRRDDNELDENQTGEDYIEVVVEATN